MRVLAALSGGVDSAVAAARAVAAGHDVVGVHMALSRSQERFRSGSRGCCSLEDAGDARRCADLLGIPFYVWDLSERFEETVVADFLSEYEAGRTPNPCVRCNEHVKFRTLLDRALALGFDAVCTGHYAQVRSLPGPTGERRELHRAAEADKDQSYVLAVMGPAALEHVLFPLGDVASKAEVRAEAAERGLPVGAKPDSYDICFVADGDTRGFLRGRLGSRPGPVVDTTGREVGRHEGAYGFTVGQRRGLGLSTPAPDGRPQYVVDVRPGTNTVVVGAQELLSVRHLRGTDAVWFGPVPGDDVECLAQVRAHGAAVPASARASVGGGVEVELAGTMRGVAAGQSLVLYDGTRVLAHATLSGAHA